MNIYSKWKEIFADVQNFRRDDSAARKIVDLLKIVSFLIICVTFLFQYWKNLININTEVLPKFPMALNQFLDKYTLRFFIALIIYKVIGENILGHFVIYLEVQFHLDLLPFFNTVENIFEISTMFILSLKLSRNLILCISGVDMIISNNKNIYFTYIVCGLFVFSNWLYTKNKNYWYLTKINYTPYFDCVGNRIAQEDMVIYYGRLYKIYLLDLEECSVFREERKDFGKKEWYLSKDNSRIIDKKISLEDAVRDEKGKIKVYKYGMGERGK